MGPVSFGGSMIVNDRIVEPSPANQARCPQCRRPIRGLLGMHDGFRLDTCEGKVADPARRGASKNCGLRLLVQAGHHGWVAVAVLQQEEWAAAVNLETGEVDRSALMEAQRAAFAALAAVDDRRSA